MNKSNNKSTKRTMTFFNSDVTTIDRQNGVEDKYGVLYSPNKKRLLKAPNSLSVYQIPEGVEVICFSAFYGCDKLTEIKLPNSLKCIGWNAFIGCSSLKSLELPKGLKRIEGEAFYGCKSLSSLNIPPTVEYIGPNPITNCGNVVLSSDSIDYVIENDALINRFEKRIISYLGQEKVYIMPNGIVEIERSAYNRCLSLISVKLGTDVVAIGKDAFYYCENLESVIMSDSIVDVDQYVFCGCHKLKTVILSEKLTIISYEI